MTNFFDKLKITSYPKFILLFLLSIATLVYLSVNSYIYIILTLILIYVLSFKVNIPKFVYFLLGFSLISKLGVILIFNPPIESDFKTMYDAAKMLASGNFDYTNWDYIIRWGYQTGHIFYQAVILKLCDSVFLLKFINCLALTGTTVIMYLTIKELINEKTARFCSLLYCFYLMPVMLTTVLTNQHIPTFLFFLAFYMIISSRFDKMNFILRYSLIGIFIGIGNIMRPEGIIFILAIICYFIFLCYKDEKLKDIVKKILFVLVSYLIIIKGVSLTFELTGISKSGLGNKDPLWKFVLGTNYESNGQYSLKDDLTYLDHPKKELEVIKERTIENPGQFAHLLLSKARMFWLGNDLYWSNNYLYSQNLKIFSHEIYGTKVNEIMNLYNNQVYLLTFGLAMVGLFRLIKSKFDKRTNLYIILLCGYFIVYLFIEIMNRYTYTPRVAIFILAGYGMWYIYNRFILNKCVENIEKKNKKRKYIKTVKR